MRASNPPSLRRRRCGGNTIFLTINAVMLRRKSVARAPSNAPKTRARVVARLSRDEEPRLIAHAYRMKGMRGLLIKTLLQTGTRVSECVNIKVEEFFFNEQMILISKAKGGKSRYVPILPELAQELRTYTGNRQRGYLFETMHTSRYSPRRIQQIVKETAAEAKIGEAGLSAPPAALGSHHPPGARDAPGTHPEVPRTHEA